MYLITGESHSYFSNECFPILRTNAFLGELSCAVFLFLSVYLSLFDVFSY